MRSPREIRFRLLQESVNLYLWLRPPAPHVSSLRMRQVLPQAASVAARLRGSAHALEIERLANGVLENRIPLFGQELNFTGPIPWRRDWKHDREFPGTPYFRLVPYLSFDRVGDHKFIWELNRHQHFVLLAQAALITDRPDFMDALVSHWEDWVRENPFQCGINWTSALEVAFRALSWIWVYHLVGDRMSEPFRRRFLTQLYRHGCHLEYNLSVYFSPNTHLLGEAVALHALGILFPQFPRAAAWQTLGADRVRTELARQVHPDGAHFEQSSYYHVYALDFFLLHYVFAGRPGTFNETLIRMAEYLDALQGPARRIPLVGDDDGGRLFHPYGARDTFGRATLATCSLLFDRQEWLNRSEDLYPQAAWWLGPSALDARDVQRPPGKSQLFADSGTLAIENRDTFALIDAGGFGPFRAGHSHSDALSLVVRRGTEDILLDAGTFNYADADWRNSFRGSSAHNTVRIDRLDQAPPRGSFAWAAKPEVIVQDWTSKADWDYLDATVRYNGHPFAHRRRILFLKDRDWFLILDSAEGSGEHLVEQFWNTGCSVSALSSHALQLGESAGLVIDQDLEVVIQDSWRSPVYGSKESSRQIVGSRFAKLPFFFAALVACGSQGPRSVHALSAEQIAIDDKVWRLPPTGKPQ
jgi:Heparinase II/III-like protein/Heparinase II/III N-terminus